MAKRKKSERIESSGQNCAWPGCSGAGDFRAPRSRKTLNDYQWLCDSHIREFNKQWNYFEGMTEEEIYNFQRDAVTGHRPTWRMDQLGPNAERRLEEAFHRLFGDKQSFRTQEKPIHPRNKDALAVLDLEHPSDKAKIKSHYRELVKKYHPDVNRGNAQAEETFKKISRAYQQLMDHYVEEK